MGAVFKRDLQMFKKVEQIRRHAYIFAKNFGSFREHPGQPNPVPSPAKQRHSTRQIQIIVIIIIGVQQSAEQAADRANVDQYLFALREAEREVTGQELQRRVAGTDDGVG